MTLRRTILLGIGLALIALILVLFYTLESTLVSQFETEEKQYALDVLQRSLNILNFEFDSLESTSRDWAKWDDTYRFVQDGNQAYIEANLSDSTFTDLQIQVMAFINMEGRVVFIRTFSANTAQPTPIPPELLEQLFPGSTLLQTASSRNPRHGILVMPEAPLLVISHPILKTDGSGPAAGTLIIGRYLDDQALQRLRSLSQLSFTVYAYSSVELPAQISAAKASLQNPGDTLIQNVDEATDAGFALLSDPYDKPGYILQVDISRANYRNRQVTTSYLTIYLIMSAVVFSVTILILFEGLVLSRLARLNKEVNRIGQSGDLSQRVTVQYRDEISNLSENINRSMISLEQAQRQRQESEQRFRILVESMEDVVFTQDLTEKITNVYGRSALATEMIRLIGEQEAEEEGENSVHQLHHRAFTEAVSGHPQIYEWEADLHGQHLFMQSSLSPMRDEQGVVIGVVSVGRDITRLKLLEQDLQARLNDLSVLYEEVRRGRERLQELSSQLVEIQETERQRLAQELHDEIGQLLTGLNILIQTAAKEPYGTAVGRLQQANEVAEQLIERVRQMSLDLRPAMLDDLGLVPALTWLFERYTNQTGIEIKFQHINLEGLRFPSQVETTTYRIIQEALTNIARHARVQKAQVRIWVGANSLGIQVEDQGQGFEPEEALESHSSRGLIGMRERVERLGGEFNIVSSPQEGTLISVQFPLDPETRR